MFFASNIKDGNEETVEGNNKEVVEKVELGPPTPVYVFEKKDHFKEEDGWVKRKITAYNVGDPSQTDDTPCIGASNEDLCKLIDEGINVCAANFVELGTELEIGGLGTCYVLDRMNKRYTEEVDIAFPRDKKEEALFFGADLYVRVNR